MAIDPIGFQLAKLNKYGKIFSRCLLFRPTVIAVGVENNQDVLRSSEFKKLSVVSWSAHVARLLGPASFAAVTRAVHKNLLKVLTKLFTPGACRA